MSLELWYLLPVGFAIAVLAMSSGVSAGNFWAPVYLLWAGFEPPLAFWMTLATMLCGYGSGVARTLWQGTLDRRIITQYVPFALPATLAGGLWRRCWTFPGWFSSSGFSCWAIASGCWRAC